MQMDRVESRGNKKQKKNLVVFCPKSTKKHARNYFPLNTMEVCGICEGKHQTRKFTSLSILKSMYQGVKENVEQLCFIDQKR
jgi:hypothetical protein